MGQATRDAFGEKLADLGGKVPNLVVLDADLSGSTRTTSFIKKYPERHFEFGIAEANMVGVAAGLALDGYIPVAASFACFLAGRLETIRVSVGLNRANVKLVGTHAGVGIGDDGGSQMGLEDVGAIRSLPHFTILQPADAAETRQAVEWMVRHPGPVYLRLTRQGVEDVHGPDYRFEVGRADVIYPSAHPSPPHPTLSPEAAHYQATIFATGGTVGEALKAARDLGGRGFKVRVVNIHTLKPFDDDFIRTAARDSDRFVTVEDHHIVGGLGSAVCESVATQGAGVHVVRLGARDYGESGKSEELYEKYGLNSRHIVEAALRNT